MIGTAIFEKKVMKIMKNCPVCIDESFQDYSWIQDF